jgi:peptidylprolyl isomerase
MRSYFTLHTFLLLAFRGVAAFVAPRLLLANHQATIKAGLFAESSESTTAADPFEAYTPGQSTDLAFNDMQIGDGETVQNGDILTVHYSGRILSNDKEFDSGTFSFKLGDGNVIPGWERGMQGVRVGGKRTLKIPPGLAYGSQGAGDGVIPPNADLIFECELKSISSGPVAEFLAKTGLGLNIRTGFLVLFILSIALPKFGVGQQGFI